MVHILQPVALPRVLGLEQSEQVGKKGVVDVQSKGININIGNQNGEDVVHDVQMVPRRGEDHCWGVIVKGVRSEAQVARGRERAE